MIHVDPQPEPPDFDQTVRTPGRRCCEKNPASSQELYPYWRACLDDLHKAYRGICAYVSIYIDRATGARSVDHFIAKSNARELTYEWSNYRLACSLMNSRKGRFDDVLDPFEVEDGWFVIELAFLKLFPNPELAPDLQDRVQDTINRLGLNDKGCRDARADYLLPYIMGDISFDYLKHRCPLVAHELKRQGRVRDTVPPASVAPVVGMRRGHSSSGLSGSRPVPSGASQGILQAFAANGLA